MYGEICSRIIAQCGGIQWCTGWEPQNYIASIPVGQKKELNNHYEYKFEF
jgi:hypothetical protein